MLLLIHGRIAYSGKPLFEVSEVDKLARVADFFRLATHFTCLSLGRPG